MCQLLICFRIETRPGRTASIWNCPGGGLRAGPFRLTGERQQAGGSRSRSFSPSPSHCMPYLCLGPDRSPHSLSPETFYFSFKKLHKSHFYFLMSSKGFDRCHILLCVPTCSCHLPVPNHRLCGRLGTLCLFNWTRDFLGSVPSTCLRA